MSDSVDQAKLAASYLKIQGDPTSWGLRTAPPQDPDWQAPVALDIVQPVAGTLILSPARTGSYALTPEVWGNGWHPGPPIKLVAPYLYVPTISGMTTASHGYPLAAKDPGLPALQRSILDAMTAGTTLTVNVDVLGSGVVTLNGAQLSFAVLAEIQTN
jgi:hypothetical protein